MLYCWYYVPSWLNRMFPDVSDRCWRECADEGTFMHIWCTCLKLIDIWRELATLLSLLFDTTISLYPKYFLLPLSHPSLTRHQNKLFRHVTSATTCQIAADWKLPSPSTMRAVLNRIWYVYKIEFMTAILRNSAKTFNKVWAPWLESQHAPSIFTIWWPRDAFWYYGPIPVIPLPSPPRLCSSSVPHYFFSPSPSSFSFLYYAIIFSLPSL